MKVAAEFIKVDCTKETCPSKSNCCFLPTEIHPSPDGKVDILFVGQGGGQYERKYLRPFIGPAGRRLRELVVEARNRLKQHFGVAFSNTIRDNPKDNRVPNQEELEACLGYLYRDIKTLQPKGLKVVMLMGKSATAALAPMLSGYMIKVHGRMAMIKNDVFGAITVMSTFHPAYLIRCCPRFDPENISGYDKMTFYDIARAVDFCNKEIPIDYGSLFYRPPVEAK